MKNQNETSKEHVSEPDGKPLVISRLTLHAHNDIEAAAEFYSIPLAFYNKDSVYVLQEDRCVFVGNSAAALQFMSYNEGKYCQSRFPLNGL